MELRHLRYFVAVAEEGSLTVAAEKRLHTAQPSLSRQIRDLEYEVGVPLLTRSVHGVELTAGGRAFLDHARLALTQSEAAIEAARRAAQPAKQVFAMGFTTGQEVDWLPRATGLLRGELANIEIRVSSDHSATLVNELLQRQARHRDRSGGKDPGHRNQGDRAGAAGRDPAQRPQARAPQEPSMSGISPARPISESRRCRGCCGR